MQLRLVTHTGTFEHGCADLEFCRHELDRGLEAWNGAPLRPVVLLHGFGQNADSWLEVAPLLAAQDDLGAVYALDLRGCAGTQGLGALCTRVRDFAAWVARREGALPALVGYSMGGRIALETLTRFGWEPHSPAHPETLPVSALVLEGAGLGPVDEAARAALRERNSAWAQQVREQGVAAFMEYWSQLPLFASQRTLPQVRQDALREGRLANTEAYLIWSFEEVGQHRQALESQTLSALSTAAQAGLPVLYIAGELDGKYSEVAQRVAVSCPGVRAATVPAAGHNAHFEQPNSFAQKLACFLRS